MSNWGNDDDQPKPEWSEPHNRRKRRRTGDSVDLRHQICTNPENLGPRHETQSPNKGSNPVDISRTRHVHGYGQNNILPKLQFKESSNMVNCDQNRRQIICRRNSGDDETKKFDHFFTELDDALSRIESLIPSLQQTVCSNQPLQQTVCSNQPLQQTVCSNQPTNRASCVEDSTLVDVSKLNPRHHLLNMLERFEECTCSRDCKQINEMLRMCNNLVPLPVRDEIKLSNMIASRTMVDKPLNCVSTQSRLPTSHFSNLESEKNLLDSRNQIREANNRIGVDRVEPVKCTLCRNDSVKNQVPDHIQGLQIMPCLFKNEDMNQNRMMYKESNVKNAVSRPQGRDPFIGSVNYVRPKRVSSLCSSDYEQSHCLTKGSVSSEKSRSSKRISFRDRDNRSKKNMMLSDSYSSSSETYRSTSNGSDRSYESEVQSRGRDWSSRRKEIEASDSTLGYDTSNYKSQDSYSAVVSTSQSRPSWSQDHDLNRNKRGGRFKQFKKKLGMIFHHHHHHHHHHYHRSNESDVGHGGSFWKHIGKMFHPKRKSDSEKPKGDKSKKSVIKSVPNQKQGHHGGLVHALVKHMRHSKKSKKAKDNFVRLGNSQHNKRKVDKLPGLPKINKRKGGLKVYNKGKLNLKQRKKRLALTAAKMILQER